MYAPTSFAGRQLTVGWGDSSHCLVFTALHLLANSNGEQGSLYLSQPFQTFPYGPKPTHCLTVPSATS